MCKDLAKMEANAVKSPYIWEVLGVNNSSDEELGYSNSSQMLSGRWGALSFIWLFEELNHHISE